MDRKKLDSVLDELTHYEDQVELLTNAAIHNEERIDSVSNNMVRMELRAMRKNLMISGLDETADENCIEVVSSLFNDMLKISKIEVEDAFRIGSGNTRMMLVRLCDPKDKRCKSQNLW